VFVKVRIGLFHHAQRDGSFVFALGFQFGVVSGDDLHQPITAFDFVGEIIAGELWPGLFVIFGFVFVIARRGRRRWGWVSNNDRLRWRSIQNLLQFDELFLHQIVVGLAVLFDLGHFVVNLANISLRS